ncbi:hypothetical protein QOT17_011199 [Balamuthia mandrillaris]
MGSRTTSTLVVRLAVHFTEKLPNGPYVEQGQGQTKCAVYVHPTATVGDVHSVYHKSFDETYQLQQEGLPLFLFYLCSIFSTFMHLYEEEREGTIGHVSN